MRVELADAAALRQLKPLEVAAYLRAMNWRKEANLNGKATLWSKTGPEGEEFDLTLPSRREFGDYALRMAEVLRALAVAEERSELEVFRDITTTAAADVVRVGVQTTPLDNGTLRIDQAVQLVERGRDLMLSAACAALEKRAVYARRKPQRAMEYLREVRMGQTEQGSFILTLLVPVPLELKAAQDELFGCEPAEPYGRRVTRTLFSALAAVDEAAQAAAVDGDMAPFQAAVSRGVSANMCDAILGLAEASPEQPIDFRISWSRSRPGAADVPTRVLIAADRIPVVQEAARQFRERAPVDDYELEGIVTRLARSPAASQGDVTVEGVVDGRMRRVSMPLSPDTYSIAVKAHEHRVRVRCTGELTRDGAGFRLQTPRHFEIVDDGELD
ncbi:MAG TPA: hypothetical protein PK694_01240 [Rhodospirillales bacterium]|jgi:hypothetical protein|nr:hypothetical protein [Rhodospirillales bacterium]